MPKGGVTVDIGAVRAVADLPRELQDRSAEVGMRTDPACRAGSFFQLDQAVVLASSSRKDVRVTDLAQALEDDDEARGLAWTLVPRDLDSRTLEAARGPEHGVFVRVGYGSRITLPVQACLFLGREGSAQVVHNMIVSEPGSEAHILTGCTSGLPVRTGRHVGVTEIWVGEGAVVTSTMIHKWGSGMEVFPRTAARIAAGGIFVSTFVSLGPVRTLDMNPLVTCAGPGASVRLSSSVAAAPGASLDVGAVAVLAAAGTSAQVVSRAVTTGGRVVARGRLVGEVGGVKGHLDCRGLILPGGGSIRAIPELSAGAEDVGLTHEAAVGRIAEEQIVYLMSRGLDEEAATSAIVQGFIRLGEEGLPEEVAVAVRRASEGFGLGGC